MGAVTYVLRRLAWVIILLLLISFLIFSLMFLAPGNTAEMLLGTQPATAQAIHAIELKYHLNDPFFVQYWHWLSGVFTLNFGTSVQTGVSVLTSFSQRLPITLFLGIYSFIVTIVIGIPLGVLAAVRRRGVLDRIAVIVSVVGVSAPAFVTGTVLLYVFAVALGWFPSYGVGTGFGARVWHLTLPAFAMGISAMGLIVKMTRAAMIDVLERDYVTFARARGMSNLRVILGFGLRNAAGPIITACGLVMAIVLTGTILIEVTFSLPGAASLLVSSVRGKDIPVVQGFTLMAAALIMLVNVATDLVHVSLDPRLRRALS
jgi:peptide/nickel transport system permease protein